MAIVSKGSKPDSFEPRNSLKLSLTNFLGLCSNFVEYEFFVKSKFHDIVALCETNLHDSIDSGNFCLRGFLPLKQRDSITHMHVLAVYVKEAHSFVWDLSPENCGFLLIIPL